MKTVVYSSVLVFLALLSLSTESEAFSRRSSGSEVAQSQAVTTPLNTTLNNTNVSAQAVLKPPVLLLMNIGLGICRRLGSQKIPETIVRDIKGSPSVRRGSHQLACTVSALRHPLPFSFLTA